MNDRLPSQLGAPQALASPETLFFPLHHAGFACFQLEILSLALMETFSVGNAH
jgi:hypothetical protein